MKTTDFIRKTIKEDQQATQYDAVDAVTLDVPLMIRLLEYAREDAKTDMDLHNVATRLIELSKQQQTLTMQNYNDIMGQNSAENEIPELTAESLEAKFAELLGEDATGGATGSANIGAVVTQLGQTPNNIIKRQMGYSNKLRAGGPVKVKR